MNLNMLRILTGFIQSKETGSLPFAIPGLPKVGANAKAKAKRRAKDKAARKARKLNRK